MYDPLCYVCREVLNHSCKELPISISIHQLAWLYVVVFLIVRA